MRTDPRPFFAPRRARAVCAIVLLAVAGNALSLPGARYVGRYDFGYAIRGDRAARPAQVFDDGDGKVFFEPRPGQPMPAVFAGKDLALLVLQPEGQYFTARTTAGEFMLVLGAARARVRRGESGLGAETPPAPDEDARLLADAAPGPAAGGDDGASTAVPGPDAAPAAPQALAGRRHEQPVVFAPGSAALKPEVLEALSALVVRIGHDATITAVGRDDGGGSGPLAARRAQALRRALLARGVASGRLRLATAPPAPGWADTRVSALRWSEDPAAAEAFDIARSDHDIAVSLRRWAQASGYELAWDVAWSAPVDGDLRLQAAGFLDAVGQVEAGLRAQGYPVRARVDRGRVVRFVASD